MIGVLLAAVGLRLAGRDRELLTNRSESRVVLDRIRDLLAAEPEVAAGGKVASVYIGPHQLMVTAEIQPLDALSGLRFGDSWLNSAGRWLRLIPRIATVFLTPAVAVEQQPELGP